MTSSEFEYLPVSVIIPSFNAKAWLAEAVESVNQGKRPADIIVIDDCSTDDSYQYALKLADEHSNLRVLKTPQNGGAAKARRLGVENSPHDWFCFLDADDLLEEGAIEKAFRSITPEVDVCLFDLWRFTKLESAWRDSANPETQELTGHAAFEATLGSWNVHAFGIYRKTLFLSANEKLSVNSFNADEILTRIIFQAAQKVYICSSKYFYRLNEHSITRGFNKKFPGILQSHRWLIENSWQATAHRYRKVVKQSIKDCYKLCVDFSRYDADWALIEIHDYLSYLKRDKKALTAALFNIKYFYYLIYCVVRFSYLKNKVKKHEYT